MKADRPTLVAYKAAAWFLRCEEAAIQAVAEVEAGSIGAFLDTDEPVILFERHKFYEQTLMTVAKGTRMPPTPGLDASELILSSPVPGGYGPANMQHAKLAAAVKLNRDAAIRSCSWGLFQIMGSNHVQAGYPDLQRFVNAMYRDVDDHLRAFVMFIRNDARLVDAIRSRNWTAFARVYNGPMFARNQYDKKMAFQFNSLSLVIQNA